MSTTAKKGFGFVVKTNEYTGNFEREMCAFVTGRIGECEVGDAYIVNLPVNFDNIMDVADDSGCHRPVSVHDNDSNNLVIFFETEPSKEQIELMKERSKLFNEARKKTSFIKTAIFKYLGLSLRLMREKHQL